MKKGITLLLVLGLALALCACGKSQAVVAVEEMIEGIGDGGETLSAALDAYNGLSDEEQSQVENIAALEEAAFATLVERYCQMNAQSSILAAGVVQVWGNVGGEDFWTYFDNVLRFKKETVLPKIMEMEEKDRQVIMALAAWAMNKNFYADQTGHLREPDVEEYEDIAARCMPVAAAYVTVLNMERAVSEDAARFIKAFRDAYPDETALLEAWSVESGLFAQSALDPGGKLGDYREKLAAYEEAMSRFQKKAELLK